MATLERIRKRSGLLIVIIGFAMLAFILTDLLGSGNSLLRADANVIGKVNGYTVESMEFSTRMTDLETRIKTQNPQQAQFLTSKQLADGAWNEVIREHLLGDLYEEMGIAISTRELYERMMANPSVQSAPIFKDQVTGQFSEALFGQYISDLEANRANDENGANAYSQWVSFEKGEKTSGLQQKMNTSISKGLYLPIAYTKMLHSVEFSAASARFVALEYSTVDDSEISVADSDLQSYYNAHKEEYKSEESASIQYVTFPIAASAEDKEAVKADLTEMIGDTANLLIVDGDTLETFASTKDDSSFALNRSENFIAPEFFKGNALPQGLDSTVLDVEVGTVVGPYESANTYRISKVVEKANLPDSARARHILISFTGLQNGNPERTGPEAKALADSLLALVKEDTSLFNNLAITLSDDKGSGAKGGDLGWFDEKAMVKPFANYVFQNDVGDMGLALSQFGFHIIDIRGQKGATPAVKLISIDQVVNPSNTTLDNIYNLASTFANAVEEGGANFSAKAEEMGYAPKVVTDLKPFDENVVGLGNNRDVVKWANAVGRNEDVSVGDIQLFDMPTNYAVVLVTERTGEGYKSLEAVKELITPKVMNELKAKKLIAKMNESKGSATNMEEWGTSLGANVVNQTLSLKSTNMQGYGNEPKVVGVLMGMEPNTMSEPIAGERAVYALEVLSLTEAASLPNIEKTNNDDAVQLRSRVAGEAFVSLKEAAKIDDRRAKFY